MNITSLVGASIVILGGLICLVILSLFLVGVNNTTRSIGQDQIFNVQMTFLSFATAGILGGSFSLYHSIRSLLRKASSNFVLPGFWIFLILYIGVVVFGFGLHVNGQEVTYPVLTILLIALAAAFPALALLSLAVRRLRFPTTWRRFTVALTSGATLGIGLALILEILLAIVVAVGQGSAASATACISNPNAPNCQSFSSFTLIFIIVAIIGPIVEELVKPIAVIAFIGRIRSASEAFILGMACGIGFDLVETVGYISSGYRDWLSVALERTGAGLLHGFGAAMVALGWYYLFHAKERRFLKFLGYVAYAIFQHFLWNATATLELAPDPVGSTINSWNLKLGFTTLPFTEVANIVEALLILVFFLYIINSLRAKLPPSPSEQSRMQAIPEAQYQTGFSGATHP